MTDLADLRWLSWQQYGDAEHDPDCRPIAWPPPEEVLAFWETGVGGGGGTDAYCTVVALVRASTADAAMAIISAAWSPGIGAWRFNREYGQTDPPSDRFSPPKWSVELKRWPWRTKQ